mgnify:CR=1 FL=1
MAERNGNGYSQRVSVLDLETGRRQARSSARIKKEVVERVAKLRLRDATLPSATLTGITSLDLNLAVSQPSGRTRRVTQQTARRFLMPSLGGRKLQGVVGWHAQQAFQTASGTGRAQKVGALARGMFQLGVCEG